MTEATAGLLVDLLDALVDEREDYGHVADAADTLGVRGILSRVATSRMPPLPEGDRVYSLLWDETLMEARDDLGELLGSLSIPYLMYKGGALLGEEYRPGDVSMVDLDVLVPLEASDRAAAALEAEGWPRQDPVGGPPLPGAPGGVFARPLGAGAIDIVEFDVHWRVAPVERLFPWRGEALPEEVWRCARRSGAGPVPRAGHHAALLVHHLVRHDLLHFRSVFDLVQLWPALLDPEESQAFAALSAEFGVARAAGWLCRALENELRLEGLGPGGPRFPSSRAPTSLRTLRSLIGLALDATARQVEAMTLARGLRRLVMVDHPVRASRTLLTDALVPPHEYLRWRWPASAGPARRIRHLGRVIGRVTEDEAAVPLLDDPPEMR